MAKTVALKGSVRTELGRRGARVTRSMGLIPGVIYGKRGTRALQFNEKELGTILLDAIGGNVLVDLELEDGGKKNQHLALIQDIQVDPLEDNVLHVDLHEVARDEKLHAEVRVVEVGEPVGAKAGGLLELVIRHLRVECLPQDLPDDIKVDVSKLEIGQAIHVGEIALPPGVTVLNQKDLPVFTVLAPAVEEVAAPAATEVKQPEAIKEKKPADGAAAAAPAAADKGKADAKAKK